MQSREDSLWESFPQKLQSCEATGRYINAFQAPFQELTLSRQEVYALQDCSLLIIPPPPTGRAAPQGDFPIDLTEINLSGWASLVQDVAASLQVLPLGLSNCLDPEMLNLLHWLEAVTQVKFCHLCYYPETSFMEPDYGADSGIWDSSLLRWGDYSEYLLGRYVRTGATSPRDFHLGPVSVEGAYTPAAGHKPTIQASHWKGQMAKGHYEHEGSSAMGSSDGTSHTPATSTLPESTSNPVSADSAPIS